MVLNNQVNLEGLGKQHVLADFRQQIARTVNVTPENLGREIKGPEQFLFEGGRYCCVINGLDGVETGFIKVTNIVKPDSGDDDYVPNLGREAFVAEHAHELDIPAVGCLTPPTEIGGKYVLIQLEVLRADEGTAYLGREMHVAAPVEVAVRGTKAILSLNRKAIPEGVDTSALDHNHERNESPEVFAETWRKENEIIFRSDNQEIVARCCQTESDNNDGIENLRGIVNTAEKYLEPLIALGQDNSREYLSHTDSDFNNMFFKNNGEVVLIDWELGAVSHNWFLAQLTDLSNFFGRCWVDPEKQNQVLSTILNSECFGDLETRYKTAYSVAVFGSMYLAKYAMDPNHHEHPMALALLGNLKGNLDFLDSEYNKLLNQT